MPSGSGLRVFSRNAAGGDITGESELGRGSTFTIRLPRIVASSRDRI
jgi:hypothetical protein